MSKNIGTELKHNRSPNRVKKGAIDVPPFLSNVGISSHHASIVKKGAIDVPPLKRGARGDRGLRVSVGKSCGIICLALIVALVILSSPTLAQSSSVLESRISRLESDNFQVRSQLSRLESQLAQLSGRSPSQTPAPNRPVPQVPPRPTRQVSSSDPMFDRLATLVIELKERVQALEKQVAQLNRQRR